MHSLQTLEFRCWCLRFGLRSNLGRIGRLRVAFVNTRTGQWIVDTVACVRDVDRLRINYIPIYHVHISIWFYILIHILCRTNMQVNVYKYISTYRFAEEQIIYTVVGKLLIFFFFLVACNKYRYYFCEPFVFAIMKDIMFYITAKIRSRDARRAHFQGFPSLFLSVCRVKTNMLPTDY